MGVYCNELKIGGNVDISINVEIICDKLTIGSGTRIRGNTRIICKECTIGDDGFIQDVLIEGSLNAGNTRICIGEQCLILQNTRLNCNDYLQIGDDVNIGQYVSIWTHASSMNVFQGYPFIKAPVKVGSHVWLTEGVKVLPGVNIGSHVVIGNLSLVNKDVPDGCFAAGVPIKIIKENIYPKKLSLEEKSLLIEAAVKEYYQLLKMKPFKAELIVDGLNVMFLHEEKETIFDCETRQIKGHINEQSEDFRDFLRYRGIKFFTHIPFKSIPPLWYQEAIKKDRKIK